MPDVRCERGPCPTCALMPKPDLCIWANVGQMANGQEKATNACLPHPVPHRPPQRRATVPSPSGLLGTATLQWRDLAGKGWRPTCEPGEVATVVTSKKCGVLSFRPPCWQLETVAS
jgi:hypothetical protein